MMHDRASLQLVRAGLLAALVAGCASSPATKRVAASPSPAAKVHDAAAATIISDNGAGVLANNGAGVISNNGAGLLGGGTDIGVNHCAASTTGTQACPSTDPHASPAPVPAALAGVEARAGAAVAGRCALPPDGPAGVNLILATTDGSPVLDPAGKPLTTKPDAKGAFRFAGIALKGQLAVVATLGAGRGQLLALARPEGVTRCDLPGTVAVLVVLDLGGSGSAVLPLATVAGLADALATLPVARLQALGAAPKQLQASLAELRKTSPALDAALAAVERGLPSPEDLPPVESEGADGSEGAAEGA